MAPKKTDGELSEREREAFLDSVTKGSTSPEEARHLRGVAGALVVGVVLLGADVFMFMALLTTVSPSATRLFVGSQSS